MAIARTPLMNMPPQKTQQSISNFFAVKPSYNSKLRRDPSPRKIKSVITEVDSAAGIEPNGDDDQFPSPAEETASISSVNPAQWKRVSVDNDETISTAREAKKRKISPNERGDYQGDVLRVCQEPDSEAVPAKNQGPRLSERTSKYLFSSSPFENENEVEEDPEIVKHKQKLHQRFVKKLGRPDSIAEIKRRNHFIEDTTAGDDGQDVAEDEEADEEDESPKPAAKGRRAATKKGGNKLTPMEKQVLDIKRQHSDTLLVVEVGYKFRFFGEDARTAAKELGIVCIPGKFRFDEHPSEAHINRFASASIPVHRLHVHVKRLVAAGHKVGVVRQLETAALKAVGDNRNTPFVRQLTNLYTKGTYIDDVEGLEATGSDQATKTPSTGHLLCLTETNAKGWGTDEKVHVGIIAVQPATGDIVYDDFEDGFMRSEIETRLLHIAPCEYLVVGELSKATEKLLQHLSASKTNVFGDKARLEYVDKPKTMAAQSYSHISNFYAGIVKSNDGDKITGNVLDKIHKLSEHVTICLSAMITHLTDYGLQHVFDLTKNFQAFSARSHMLLNGNTLTSLEIYRNQTDNTENGSLFWVLDQTQTRFGQRLLRKWVGRPLLDISQLKERIDAVEELKAGERTMPVDKIKHLLSKIKNDLEKSLIRIYYKKCTRSELLGVLQTLQRIATEYAHVSSDSDAGFQSQIINQAIVVLPKILGDVISFLDKINPEAAKENDKEKFFREEHETDDITEHKLGIAAVTHDLDAHRKIAADKLRKKKVEYVTVAGIEFLIEIDNTCVKNVPASWAKISGTKKVSRFHTPEVVRLVRERDQHKEALAAACDNAFLAMLTDISAKYQSLRDCIQSLATLDCLLSLSEVATRPGYAKPEFVDGTRIHVTGGRHPMIEQLLLDAYVPNNVDLSNEKTRALIITGPNMGGKSSYVRQVALIAIMAQIGSYVPAAFAQLGMLDAVFTRMGAFDNIMAGESTFMVELSETSDILKQATSRSLIILDELGRGTSTHDGVAIAHAVLDHIVRESKSLLLFITHYQSLSMVARGFGNHVLKNMHMRFTEGGKDEQDITFLYELGEGVAHRSYGLNVARLANVPNTVVDIASVKSKELEVDTQSSKLTSLSGSLSQVLKEQDEELLENLISGIEQL